MLYYCRRGRQSDSQSALMQKLRDKIRSKNNRRADQETQRELQSRRRRDNDRKLKPFLSDCFLLKISQHLNPTNKFLFQRPKKNVSDYDNVWYRRRHGCRRTSQKKETIFIMALSGHRSESSIQSNRSKREMSETLMAVASSSSPTHCI